MSSAPVPTPEKKQAALFLYGGAILVWGIAFGFSLTFAPLLQATPALLFLAAVAMSAYYWGLGPALVTTVLGTLAINVIFMEPRWSLLVGIHDLWRLLLFGGVAALISSVTERLRSARFQAEAAREEAEALQAALREERAQAVDRAEKLQLANEELQSQHEELQQIEEELRLQQEELQSAYEEMRRHQQRLKFLLDATMVLSGSLDYETTLQSLARVAVPALGDWCAIDLNEREPNGRPALRRVAVVHSDPRKVELAKRLREKYSADPGAPYGPAHVIRTGEPELFAEIPDSLLAALAANAEHLEALRGLELRSLMVVPLKTRGGVAGAITFAADQPGRRFGPDDLALARDLAARAALAIENARLYQKSQQEIQERQEIENELREHARTLEAIHAVSNTLVGELDLQVIVQAVTNAATELSGAQFGAFFYNVLREDGEAYTLYTLSGAPREAFANFPMPRNTAIFEPTFRGEATVRLDDVTRDPRFGKNPPYHGLPPGHLPVRSYLAVPVISRSGEVIGGLFLGHERPGIFTERAETLVTALAAQAALAVDNSRLYDQAVRSEEVMRQRAEQLEEMDRRKNEFLAMLSHELRNPLAPIRNAVHVLHLSGLQDPRLEHAREVIERQVQHLVRLVEDLLDVSRISRGKIQLRKELLDLRSVVEQAVQTSLPLIADRSHRLTVELPAEPVRLYGDPTRLVQVLSNLLNNAAKYTDPGGTISVQASPRGEEVEIVVRDNGPGIPAELLPRIFDLFTQADRSLDRAQGGLGIGLTLVRMLVELHGGRVAASSGGPGEGSAFYVLLPLVPLVRGGSDPSSPVQADASAPVSLRVMLVEDNRDSRETLAEVLEMEGHQVTTAGDGRRGLEMILSSRPHAALIDIGLPGMDGYEVARKVREGLGNSIFLIALTGYGSAEDRENALQAGFDAHLVKPVEPRELARVLGGAGREK